MSDEIRLRPGSRPPQIGDVVAWAGDGWEAQPVIARPQGVTHVHTNTIVRVAMGETRSPNFVKGSDGWCIYPDGSAEFNNIVARGTIYADAGEIGGWTIEAVYLARDTGVDATSAGMAPDDYPFYAGATYAHRATAPFRVTPAGALVATSATITGSITATSGTIGGWTIAVTELKAIGDAIILDCGGIIQVGGAAYLQSIPFASGDYGWQITPSEAEFGNITARGEIRTAVFKYGEVHAQAGQLLVTPNADKLNVDVTIAASGSFDVGEAGRFSANDVVRLKDGVADVWLTVTADNGNGTYNYTRSYGSAVGTVFRCGTAVVGYGSSGEGGVLLDAMTANGPFVDIFTHTGSPWTTLTTKARLGNLAGISDASLNPSGYGLYSNNVFLSGKLVAAAGECVIDTSGITLMDGDSVEDMVKWRDDYAAAPDIYAGKIYAHLSAGSRFMYLVVPASAGVSYGSRLFLWPEAAAGGTYARGEYTCGKSGGSPAYIKWYATGTDNAYLLLTSTKLALWNYVDVNYVERAYIAGSGDVHPDADGRGLFARVVNRLGIQTYDDHFRSGSIPTGYVWQGAPFGGTPSVLYAFSGDYLKITFAASTRYFLSRAVTNVAANWQNKSIWVRARGGIYVRVGARFDDGTDNNYVEILMDGSAADGTQTLIFRYRAGGGGVTTVTSPILVPVDGLYVMRLLMYYSAPNYAAYGYLIGEDGTPTNISGFYTAVTWAPVAGRAGIILDNSMAAVVSDGVVDWIENGFV